VISTFTYRYCRFCGRRSDWSVQVPKPRNDEHECVPDAAASGSPGNRGRMSDRRIGLQHGQGVPVRQGAQGQVMASSYIVNTSYSYSCHSYTKLETQSQNHCNPKFWSNSKLILPFLYIYLSCDPLLVSFAYSPFLIYSIYFSTKSLSN